MYMIHTHSLEMLSEWFRDVIEDTKEENTDIIVDRLIAVVDEWLREQEETEEIEDEQFE